jgi:hypothetical protein
MVQSTTSEEQRYARHEILICADLICAEALERENEPEPSSQAIQQWYVAPFAAAVREYLRAELELEAMNPTDDKRARLVLADAIEKEFAKCTHAPAEDVRALWCAQCGAGRAAVAGAWRRPNWRQIVLRALLAGVLMMLVGCGGSVLDIGTAAELDAGADVAPCPAGWADCDGDPRNGCETSLRTTLNCGYCSHACIGDAGCTPHLTCQ